MLTGASGFVGRHVAEALLQAGDTVIGVGRDPGRLPAGVLPVPLDLLADPRAAAAVVADLRPQVLVHAAWSTEHGRYWNDPANLDWSALTLTLARAVVEAGGRRIVTIGTCAEYDWSSLGTSPCSEDNTPERPHTLYGAAKHATARLVQAYCRGGDVSHAHARLFLLYGPHEQPQRLVPSLVRSLLAGAPARVTSGRQERDFMDVRDAGRAIAMLARGDFAGTVNVASGQAVSVRTVAGTIGALTGRPELIRYGALPDRPQDPPCLAADTRVLRSATGFRPAIGLQDGLRAAIDWWREEQGPIAGGV